ncbi:MAG: hypothetical protein HOY69_13660 [Streptomyces sp.]|nr:hypothetical protein [Streptomyces sp.]
MNIPYTSQARALIEKIPPHRRLPLAAFAIPQFVLLLWWAAFFPGAMSYDSIAYVWHVTTDHWMSNHSVVYDSMVWVSLETTGDLWPLTLLQTIAMSATIAYTCVMLRDFGVRARFSLPAAAALVLLPSTGSFVVFVWKDVPYTIGALLAFAATGRLIARRLRGRSQARDRAFYREIGLLFLGCLCMGVFRTNGLLVMLFAAPVLLFTLPKVRRWVLAATIVPVIISTLLQTVVYPAVGIQTPTKDQVYAMQYADIAVAYGKVPQTFSKHDLAIMEQVAPLSHWGGAAATCYSADPAMSKPMDRKAAARLNSQLLDIWSEVAKRTPQVLIGARLCRSHIAWAIWPGPADKVGYTLISTPVTPKNLFGWADWNQEVKHSKYRPVLKMRPLSSTLHKGALFAFNASKTPQLDWLFFRGAIWCYMSYAIAIVMMRKRRQRGLAGLMAFTIGLQLCVLAANPAPLFRYMVAPMFIGFFFLPLLTVRTRLTLGPDTAKPARRPAPAPAPAGDMPEQDKPLTPSPA